VFRKILVPLDGSENAERALPWVKRYAGPPKAEVVLFRAVTQAQSDTWFPSEPGASEAREYLGRIERELNYADIPAKIVVKVAPAATAIVAAASEEQGELIVMTTRGGSKVGRWLVGGITEQVMRLSPVPVLVVRSQTPLARQGRVRRILVPLDGSGLSETVLPWAEKLARFHRARLVFVHVYPRGPRGTSADYDERYDALLKRTRRTIAALAGRGVKARVHVERGDAAEGILRTAGTADLIAMTTHGYGGFKRWMFGSVAEKVIHEAYVPVFVYKGAVPAREAAPRRARLVEPALPPV
jgi:nucleotide-binding universal stress UspA family protein